jgi:hypothetical protein
MDNPALFIDEMIIFIFSVVISLLPIFARHVGIPLLNLQYPFVIPPLFQISLPTTLKLRYIYDQPLL